MTRYEFAAALCRALENGVKIDDKAAKEFEREMSRIRVDHVKGEDGAKNRVARVRLNVNPDTDKYGNKLTVSK